MQSSDYEERRKRFMHDTVYESKYSGMQFTEQEQQANDLFLKKVVPSFVFDDDFYYDLAMKYKDKIQAHTFFNDLASMPKGALLHHHMTDCIDVDWITEMVKCDVYNKNIYQRDFSKDVVTKYPLRLVYTLHPRDTDIPVQKLINDWKAENPGKTDRDFFMKHLSMLPDEIAQTKNNDDAWALFMPKYFFALPLLRYEKFYKQHLMNLFTNCAKENIYRIESRLTPGFVTDEEMNLISPESEMDLYRNCVEEIRKTIPSFSFGIIVEMIRRWKVAEIERVMRLAFALKQKYPELIAGMDLDGDEDNFPTFEKLSDTMLKADDLKKEFNVEIPWILHCGESLKVTQENPIDGYLFNARRFGHGINLYKHSYLLPLLKQEKICIEINPISNQTLRNVRDLRMHPAIGYLNMGIKISLNNDDPTLYNTKGVGYDFFVATVCCQFNIFDLKVIILNSIECSQAAEVQKQTYFDLFKADWAKFIEGFIKKYS